ncbi:MAG: class I SAM-dependent methyltransferase [Chloroflexota bacterium]
MPDSRGGPSPEETERTRKRYDRSASTYDLLWAPGERLFIRRMRRDLWRRAPAGRVLEVGVGTGENIRFYPPGAEVTAVDISNDMMARAKRRPVPDGASVEFRHGDVQSLDIENDAFDAAVATFVFCSVPDPGAGLRELRRVVRPGGRVLMLEHVRVDLPGIGALMDIADPISARLTGSHINRQTGETVRRAGFASVSVESRGPLGIVRLIDATV